MTWIPSDGLQRKSSASFGNRPEHSRGLANQFAKPLSSVRKRGFAPLEWHPRGARTDSQLSRTAPKPPCAPEQRPRARGRARRVNFTTVPTQQAPKRVSKSIPVRGKSSVLAQCIEARERPFAVFKLSARRIQKVARQARPRASRATWKGPFPSRQDDGWRKLFRGPGHL